MVIFENNYCFNPFCFGQFWFRAILQLDIIQYYSLSEKMLCWNVSILVKFWKAIILKKWPFWSKKKFCQSKVGSFQSKWSAVKQFRYKPAFFGFQPNFTVIWWQWSLSQEQFYHSIMQCCLASYFISMATIWPKLKDWLH